MFHKSYFPEIKTSYIDTGKVKFVYHDFPLTSIHKDAYPAAIFAKCSYKEAGNGAYLKVQDKLYSTMDGGNFNYDEMSKFATTELGIDKNTLKDCYDNNTYKDEIDADIKLAETKGITGTPGFLVNGKLVVGAGPNLEQTIEEELAKVYEQ